MTCGLRLRAGWIVLLLLKVSGVAMLENTFSDRRPEYADYIRLTNAFFPGPRRENDTRAEGKL